MRFKYIPIIMAIPVMVGANPSPNTLLTGSNTLNGGDMENTFVNNGVINGNLIFNGPFENWGSHQLGNSPGFTPILGDYIEASELNIALGNPVAVTGYSQVRVGGNVYLQTSSILNIETWNNILPVRGNVYQIIANSAGFAIPIHRTFSSVQFNSTGTFVKNAAVVFDVATGQLLATGLNSNTSTFADLGTNENQRRAASTIFKVAQIGQNQINTHTLPGTLASQLINAQSDPKENLARYTPTIYGAMTDYIFLGDRALIRNVWNRVSPLSNASEYCTCDTGMGGFIGYLGSYTHGINHAHLKRNDYYVGIDFSYDACFSLGGVYSANTGSIKNHFGKSYVDGSTGLLYGRKTLGDCFTGFGTLLYSAGRNKWHRPTLNGSVKGTNHTSSWTGNLGLQYTGWTVKKISIAPHVNLLYSHGRAGGFTEKGAIDALHNKGYRANLLTGELGFSFLYRTELFSRDLNIEAVTRFEKTFKSDKSKMDINVVDSPAINYSLYLNKKEPAWFNYGVNFGYSLWKCSTLYVGYEGQCGNEWEQFVNIGLRFDL